MELPMHRGHGSGDGPDEGKALDPVCGMTVDTEEATQDDLHLILDGTDYYFCGRGCKLDFGDDPARYLDPSYTPSM